MFGQGKKRNNSSSREIDHGLFLFPFLILVHLLLENTSGRHSPSAGAIVNFIGIFARRRGRSCTFCYKQRFVCPPPSLPLEVATQHNDASISRVELEGREGRGWMEARALPLPLPHDGRRTRTHASAAGNNNDARYSILPERKEEDKEREIIDTIFAHPSRSETRVSLPIPRINYTSTRKAYFTLLLNADRQAIGKREH